ncbi:MAG: diguanylate cyclase [Spirochaetales bacterium]|nr:diguanylate cyclase [Spirochaetales bacterium]
MPKRGDRDVETLVNRLIATGKLPAILRGLGVFLKDYASGASLPNTLWTDLGYGPDELRNDLWRRILHPDDRDRVLASWERVYRGEADAWTGEYRISDVKGEWHRIRHRTLVLERDGLGVPTLTVGVDDDITELADALDAERARRVEAEGRLLDAELLRSASAVASSALDTVEAADRVLAQARSIIRFDAALAWSNEGAEPACVGSIGIDERCSDAPHETTLEAIRTRQSLIVRGGEAACRYPARSRLCVPLVLRDKVVGALEFLSLDEEAFDGAALRRAMSFGETAAVALANALRFGATEREAMTDWLTGLGTRRRFEERGKVVMADERCTRGASLLMIDIDRFKQVNDSFGHAAGDTVLTALGAICRSSLREGDLVARYGGEELVALMPAASAKAASEAAERIRWAAELCEFPGRPELRFTVSVGAYSGPVDRSDPEAELVHFLKEADDSLYRAKESGRNRVVARSEGRKRKATGSP